MTIAERRFLSLGKGPKNVVRRERWLTRLRRCERCGQEKLRLYWPAGEDGHCLRHCRECDDQIRVAREERRLLVKRSKWPSIRKASGEGERKAERTGALARRREREERAAVARAEREAVRAWREWLRFRGSDEAVRRYYHALGTPWLNRRLTDAERYAVRYENDPAFRQLQIHRAGHRKRKLREAHDGTLGYAAFALLYAERTSCPYCGAHLTEKNRVLDHMDPIARGGAHSASNLTPACDDCNTKKRDTPFATWLARLSPEHQQVARAVYEAKRRGHWVLGDHPPSFAGRGPRKEQTYFNQALR